MLFNCLPTALKWTLLSWPYCYAISIWALCVCNSCSKPLLAFHQNSTGEHVFRFVDIYLNRISFTARLRSLLFVVHVEKTMYMTHSFCIGVAITVAPGMPPRLTRMLRHWHIDRYQQYVHTSSNTLRSVPTQLAATLGHSISS